MQLALSGTELDHGDNLATLCGVAVSHGIGSVELWHPANTGGLALSEIVEILAERSIEVAAVSSGTEMARDGSVAEDQQLLTEAIELANELGAATANTYFGYLGCRDDAAAIDLYARNLAPCLRVAERLGVVITLENEFDAFGHDHSSSDVTRRPEALLRLLERIASPFFRLTFDPCNALFAGLDPLAFLRALQPYFATVHVKDGRPLANAADPDGWRVFVDEGRRYATCRLGEGEVPWPAIIRQLHRTGYRGRLVLEPHAAPGAYRAAWAQAVARARQWLAQSGEEA